MKSPLPPEKDEKVGSLRLKNKSKATPQQSDSRWTALIILIITLILSLIFYLQGKIFSSRPLLPSWNQGDTWILEK
ncbi:hypothetical protein A3A66_03580 [Microgenomates group bacterium RIFCSPLOWO2_01_FULL_46_13]|nr:MAG: hypothetical protein A2783_04760 [Microgenomates group bacterium RIFCSPHIGHO2_01_FULL_45_11]OGV95065.1 MAG: hypothetical protein A3A66_03580 [Microgenomates group bacterium RIFCSPLOWO2_01_FULL_46_13]